MRFPAITIAALFLALQASAQNEPLARDVQRLPLTEDTQRNPLAVDIQSEPLVADPGQDQFELCRHLYRHANSLKEHYSRIESYQRLAPRLESYIQTFPNHANTPAAMYYLGECYYQFGAIDNAKRVLQRVIRVFKQGRYVALSANRLAYDAFHNKKYGQAAVQFNRVARFSDTAAERYRGRYQEASCYRFAGDTHAAIRAYSDVEAAEDAISVYRENSKLRLGHLYLEKKDNVKAREKFSGLILPAVAEKLRIEAFFYLGLIALEEKDNPLAEAYFKKVLISGDARFKSRSQAALMNTMFASENYQGVLDTLKRGVYEGEESTEVIKYTIAGKSAIRLKRYGEAIKYFGIAERQIPLSEEAFTAGYYRLLCFFNIEGANIPQQVEGFLEIYQKRYPKNPRIHKALLMKAETLFDQGDSRKAADAYNKIDITLVGEDNEANFQYKRGWCLSESGDHNSAVRSFTEFINNHSEDKRVPHAIARRGKSYKALGDRGSALKDFDLLIQRYPKDKLASLAWQSSARIKKEDKDYKGMILRYKAMLSSFPHLKKSTVANAQYWIGWGSYQEEKYKEAIEALEVALRLDPSIYGFKAGMLMVYCSYSLKDEALLHKAVRTVIDLGKGEEIQRPIYRWLGVQFYNSGDSVDAERYLTLGTTAIEPRQTPKSFWKMLGRSRVETAQYEKALEAIKNFLDVVEEDFWKAEALLDQAQAYVGLKDFEKAKTSAEAGLQLRPKGRVNAELRLVLGDIAYHQKDYAAAAGFYVVVVQFAADQELRPEALLKAHQALLKKGDAKQAQHYLDILNKEFPEFRKKKLAPAAQPGEG